MTTSVIWCIVIAAVVTTWIVDQARRRVERRLGRGKPWNRWHG